MSSPKENVSRKTSTKQAAGEKSQDIFQNKRKLLSYWKSLESPTSQENEDETDIARDELLEELKKSVDEMDLCVSDVIIAEKETNQLRDEQLTLFKELEHLYMQHFIKEKSNIDLNDNLKREKHGNGDNQKDISTLKPERDSLLEENGRLIKEVEKLNMEYKSSNKDQQQDIEKLTREVQSANIARRKLERELFQAMKLKDGNEVTISSLREELQTMKATHDNEVKKLNSINEQVSKDNSELVEKGKEAAESLKVAVQELTDEKKALQDEKRSISDNETKVFGLSLERTKKERETFRQRCEKSEMQQRDLQQKINSLQILLKEKEDSEIKLRNEEVSSGGNDKKKSNVVGADDLTEGKLESAQSRISQLKNYVHVLEDRVKEKEERILSLRNENARANDVGMEKSLELSRSRRVLERKIDKLVKENSEWKMKFLIPDSSARTVGKEQLDPSTILTNNKQENMRVCEEQLEITKGRKEEEIKNRRTSNPEKSAIETSLKQYNKVVAGNVTQQQQQSMSANVAEQPSNAVSNHSSSTKNGKNYAFTPVEVRAIDVAPRRRIGGKFIRASSKRHSADLGKLMSRHLPASAIERKSDSDLHRNEPATIFVNKYRKGSAEEHWV